MVPLLLCLALFAALVFGLGVPLVAAGPWRADEKLGAGAALGVILIYLAAMIRYWLDLPAGACVLLAVAAAGLVAWRRRACAAVARDPAARRMAGAWLLVAGWSLAFLALVRTYSGGGWALDWADHYDRARLFLHHWPAHWRLYGGDTLPTRPPLANAVTSVFLALSRPDFAYFQIFTTLAATLAFLPAWLWAGRFGAHAPRAQALFTLLFLLNPSVVENATFAWTKLPTVFFVLSSLYALPWTEAEESPARTAACFGFLAAALLTHYSAAPYVVALAAAWVWWRRGSWRRRAFWVRTLQGALAAAALAATWFAWALAEFGWKGTLFSNTSVTETTARSAGGFLHEKGLNLVNTLVPHFLRPVDYEPILRDNPLSFLRDYCFQLYQVNLPMMFGLAGAATLGWTLARRRRAPAAPGAPPPAFWWWFAGCAVVLGTAASGGIDHWGVAHLCLQSLLLLGLAVLAARLDETPRWWRAVYAAGLAVDFALGVGLQFLLENRYYSPAETMRRIGQILPEGFDATTWVNLRAQTSHGYEYVGNWPIARPLLVLLLACLLALALVRLRGTRDRAPAP